MTPELFLVEPMLNVMNTVMPCVLVISVASIAMVFLFGDIKTAGFLLGTTAFLLVTMVSNSFMLSAHFPKAEKIEAEAPPQAEAITPPAFATDTGMSWDTPPNMMFPDIKKAIVSILILIAIILAVLFMAGGVGVPSFLMLRESWREAGERVAEEQRQVLLGTRARVTPTMRGIGEEYIRRQQAAQEVVASRLTWDHTGQLVETTPQTEQERWEIYNAAQERSFEEASKTDRLIIFEEEGGSNNESEAGD